MADTSYNKAWESELDNVFFKKGKAQDINIDHIKLQVHDT